MSAVNDGRVVNRRPRRWLSREIRTWLRCPLCSGDLTVVAFRARTCRLRCRTCELRFSVDPVAVGIALENAPEAVVATRTTLEGIPFVAEMFARGMEAPTADERERVGRRFGRVLAVEAARPGVVRAFLEQRRAS